MDFPTGGMHHPAGEPPRPDGGIGRVSHDMERIFGPATLSANRDAPPQNRAIVPIHPGAPAKRRGASGRWAMSAIAIGGAVALSIGLVFDKHSRDHTAAAPPPAPTSLRSHAPPPVHAPPIVATPSSAPVLRAAAREEAPVEPRRVAAPPPVRTAALHPPRHVGAKTAVASPAARAEHRSDGIPCAGVARAALAWCMRPQVVDADRALRQAYRQAAHAGVGRRTLITYRQRWLQMRRQANADPRGVVIGYREIARQLDSARTGRP